MKQIDSEDVKKMDEIHQKRHQESIEFGVKNLMKKMSKNDILNDKIYFIGQCLLEVLGLQVTTRNLRKRFEYNRNAHKHFMIELKDLELVEARPLAKGPDKNTNEVQYILPRKNPERDIARTRWKQLIEHAEAHHQVIKQLEQAKIREREEELKRYRDEQNDKNNNQD